jgi:hypothetical protein
MSPEKKAVEVEGEEEAGLPSPRKQKKEAGAEEEAGVEVGSPSSTASPFLWLTEPLLTSSKRLPKCCSAK